MVKCLPDLSIFTEFLKNRNFIPKIKRSKVTDYAALRFRTRNFFHVFTYIAYVKHVTRRAGPFLAPGG